MCMCMFVSSPHGLVVYVIISQRHTPVQPRQEKTGKVCCSMTDFKPGPEQYYEQYYESRFIVQVEVSV